MKCENCGKNIDDNSKFCIHCGATIKDNFNEFQTVEDRIVFFPSKEEPIYENRNNKQNKPILQKNNKYFYMVIGVLLAFTIIFLISQKPIITSNPSNEEVISNDNENNTSENILKDTTNNQYTNNDLVEKSKGQEKSENEMLPQTTENKENYMIDSRKMFTTEEIEQEVLRIRKIYNEQQSNVKNNKYKVIKDSGATAYYKNDLIDMVVVKKGTLDVESSRTYNFEQGELIFAYIEAEDGVRLYFKDGYLMRFRYASNAKDNTNSINYDDPNNDMFLYWEEFGLNEAYGYYSSFTNLIEE